MEQPSKGAFLYIDLSNVYIGAMSVGNTRPEVQNSDISVRIDYEKLIQLANNLFNIHYIRVAGAHLSPMLPILDKIEESGKEYKAMESPISNHREIFADEHLQIAMLHDLLDYEPNVAVVMTGDGNGANKEMGFFEEIMRMHSYGWEIVLMSWEKTCHQSMRNWVERNGDFVTLDEHYDDITYHVRKWNGDQPPDIANPIVIPTEFAAQIAQHEAAKAIPEVEDDEDAGTIDPLSKSIREIDRLEARMNFVGYSMLCHQWMLEWGMGWDEQECRQALKSWMYEGIIERYDVTNPHNPDYPTSAVRLIRSNETVRSILGSGQLATR